MLKWCFELRSLERVFSDRRERSCLVGVAPPSTDAPEAEGFPWFPPTRISMQCRLPGNCLRTATQRLTTRSVYDSGLYEGEGLCFKHSHRLLGAVSVTRGARGTWHPPSALTQHPLLSKQGYATTVNKYAGTFFSYIMLCKHDVKKDVKSFFFFFFNNETRMANENCNLQEDIYIYIYIYILGN